MRTKLSKFLATAFAAVGLMSAAGYSQQAAAPPQEAAQAKPAVSEGLAQAAFSPTTPAEKAIVTEFNAFTKAYEAADVKALGGLYADDAVIVDPEGIETRGNAAIVSMYADAFESASGLKLEARIEAVRFLTNDVARVEGQSRLSTSTGDATEFIRYSSLLVQKDGRWKIAEIREYPAPAEDVAPYERLKDLEWMVGEWVNEGENDKVTASIRWADNHSYLVRAYAAEIRGEKKSSGTMFIGWDPQSGQIKSWLFDSEGGHGEGVWTRTGEDQWVVKAQGVLRNGLPTSATQIHTILNKDSVKTDSVDRILGGQIAPDVVDVVMVRKAPAPGDLQPKAAVKKFE